MERMKQHNGKRRNTRVRVRRLNFHARSPPGNDDDDIGCVAMVVVPADGEPSRYYAEHATRRVTTTITITITTTQQQQQQRQQQQQQQQQHSSFRDVTPCYFVHC
uniref:Uncharacterized protein n=1 Tax=Vespula pensylvanica TaxID=30213 RepID=A0A834N0T9_VESPE|nr:hypothetical protein H0235_017266 [Vespula pensylvanica]